MIASAESIADQAGRLSEAERDTWLTQACAGDEALRQQVEALLAARTSMPPSSLSSDNSGPGETMLPPKPHPATPSAAASGEYASFEAPGQMMGRYKLLQILGEGGFGSVWMAEQREPVVRKVALKLIKLGMDTRQVIARFEAERQALALMDHPNIAKVLDAGTTAAGRPFFVMELVKGVPIVEYCDRERLDTRRRLELFVSVCKAIHHAHQKGIIHRDIKPSNILIGIGDGGPEIKVIDFGIAKATSGALTDKTLFTEHFQMIGTPAYMSPEQAENSALDIDTRSDVYSLGVLLYELLTGTTPYDAGQLMRQSMAELMRVIREEDPPTPSTRVSSLGLEGPRTAEHQRLDVRSLRRRLRGDLDWIVMRCLEKDRTRRYDSCAALADDILRHLRDEPVVAGPPGTGYRIGKFVRRHRAQVAGAAALLVALVLGVVGTSIGWNTALREQARAQAAEEALALRAAELEQVAAFQAAQLRGINTARMGESLRAGILAQLETVQDNESLAFDREEIRQALATVNFTNVALQALDKHVFEQALSVISSQFEQQPAVRTQLLLTLANTMRLLGLLERAMTTADEALALLREHVGDDNASSLEALNLAALVRVDRGNFDQGEPMMRAALAGRERLLGPEHADTLMSLSNLGWMLRRSGRQAEAEEPMRRSLDLRTKVLGAEHADTLQSMDNLGILLTDLGRTEEAEVLLRRAWQARERILGAESLHSLHSLNSLAALLIRGRRYAEAERLLREGVEIARRELGSDHPHTLLMSYNLAHALLELESFSEATRYAQESWEGRLRLFGPGHRFTIASQSLFAGVLERAGQTSEAAALYRRILQSEEGRYGRRHASVIIHALVLARTMRSEGKQAEALALLHERREDAVQTYGDSNWRLGVFQAQLAMSLIAAGQSSDATALADQALVLLAAAPTPPTRLLKAAADALADHFSERHEVDAAAGHAKRAEAWRKLALAP